MTTETLTSNAQQRSLDAEEPSFAYRLPQTDYVDSLTPKLSQQQQIPSGFPAAVQSAGTWTGEDIAQKESQWILQLTSAEVEAIQAAVIAFRDSNQPLQALSVETFVLPQELSAKLHTVSPQCYRGLGFCVLRGLPGNIQDEMDKAIIFAGVSAHVASVRGFQDDERKHVLAHLSKRYRSEETDYVPPSFDSTELSFHTDSGDIVALYYATMISKGGKTLLASGNQVYNEIAATRPDILHTLASEWAIDRYYGPRDKPVQRLPLLHKHGEGGITLQFSRLPFSNYLGSLARRADIAPLTEEQTEALNVLQSMSKKHKFAVPTVPGDVLYFNNVSVFHGREPYVESTSETTEPSRMDRHLLRLWLQDPEETQPLSKPLQQIWDEIYAGKPDQAAEGRKELWFAKAKDAYALNSSGNG